MTVYVNLFGGPGCGKSTLAAFLFAEMKVRGYSVELVTEFVKDLLWENRAETIQIQPYVSAKQFRNLARLNGKVDFVITDSPILKDTVYAQKYTKLPKSYYDFLEFLHNELNPNINLFVNRKFAYDTEGRFQTELEAVNLDKDIKFMLAIKEIPFVEVEPDLHKILGVLDEFTKNNQ